MFSELIVSGDSFSSGYGLSDTTKSWPSILANKLGVKVRNLAKEGLGNEHIINSIMSCDDITNKLVICGLTHFSRVEFINAKTYKKFTTIPNRRGQTEFENIFWQEYYDDEYYYEKFIKQLILFTTFLESKKASYLLFDALPINHTKSLDINNYLWFGKKNMCDIIYPNQLADGHPSESGHIIMALTLYKIILDKFG